MIAWTYRLAAAAGGLAFSRETGHVLAWDAHPWLVLLNHRGERQGQVKLHAPVVSAAIADDGSALAVADDRAQMAWLARDLSTRWRLRLPDQPTSVAVDPLGRGLAVADAVGRLHFYDRTGNVVRPPAVAHRPIVHLLAVPAAPLLVAAADFGLVGTFDRLGRWLWRDVPVVHVGSVASSGDAQIVAASCFSEGVRRYDGGGRQLPAVPTPEPCRVVAVTYAGGRLLVGGVFGGIYALDSAGRILWDHRADQPVVGLGLSPLGDRAAVALADGRLIGFDLGGKLR